MASLPIICQNLLGVLSSAPAIWVVAAISFLPLFGVPVIPLLVIAGLRFGPLLGSVVACGSLVLNLSCGYWLAARWLRCPLEKFLLQRGHKIPEIAPEDEIKFILLCRLAPGLPLTFQNYMLGGARVRFGRYLLVSLPIQLSSAVGFVIFGNSLAHSSVWKMLVAASLVAALLLLLNLAHKWSRRPFATAQRDAAHGPAGACPSRQADAGRSCNPREQNSSPS